MVCCIHMSDITKTIPQKVGIEVLNSLFDGSIEQFEFHMSGTPKRLKEGDYVYTIFDNQLIGRLKIKRFVAGEVNPKSGRPRTLIYVKAPGERLSKPIPKKGHRGTRYFDGADWPK